MAEITFEQVLSQVKALPPEDAVKLRDYLNAQIQQDEAVEEARVLARATSARNLSDEYRWIEEHREEYAGQWVTLKGRRLISSGPNGVEVIRAARDAGFPDAFIKLVLPAYDGRISKTRKGDFVGLHLRSSTCRVATF